MGCNSGLTSSLCLVSQRMEYCSRLNFLIRLLASRRAFLSEAVSFLVACKHRQGSLSAWAV